MSQATEAFWLLSDPFEPRPDIRFLVPSQPIRTALSALRQTLQAEESQWTLVVGYPGIGKGVLVQLFVEAWTETRPIVVIPDSAIPYGALSAQIREQLEPATDLSAPIVFLEGAEDLSPEVVSALERDENETGARTRFVAVIDQSPESTPPHWAQQRQARVIALEPMDAVETRSYIQRRVRLAAGGERDLFEESALHELHRRAEGVPGTVNKLARRALDEAASVGAPWVTADAVTSAARDLDDLPHPVAAVLDSETLLEPDTVQTPAPLPDTHREIDSDLRSASSQAPAMPLGSEIQDLMEAGSTEAMLEAEAVLTDKEEWQTDVILEEELLSSRVPAPIIAFGAWVLGVLMGATLTFYFLGSWEDLRAHALAKEPPVIAKALNRGGASTPPRSSSLRPANLSGRPQPHSPRWSGPRAAPDS
ncbi:MAG: hypothetical protein P8M78_13315 [Myxococcota bacterium]|nr:hypothetical protein [Myxococcota bacterium]